jgi:hypothetical protein
MHGAGNSKAEPASPYSMNTPMLAQRPQVSTDDALVAVVGEKTCHQAELAKTNDASQDTPMVT